MKFMTPQPITLTSSNVAASAYADWNSATSYTAGNRVYFSGNYGEYEALTSNTNKQPDINPLDWKFLGTSNKYKMFDQFLNTQTTNSGSIEVEVVAYGSNGVYLGNLDCNTVSISVVNNDTLTVIESVTYTMYSDVIDWLDYFYGEWLEDKKDSVMYERTTLSLNISYIITIDNGLSTAACGIFACGPIKQIGLTKFGITLGALDYSTVTVNETSGAAYLQTGNYAKTISFDVFAHTSSVPAVYKVLVAARGRPMVFIPASGYDVYTVYGYIRQFDTLVNGPVETAITGEIIGLI